MPKLIICLLLWPIDNFVTPAGTLFIICYYGWKITRDITRVRCARKLKIWDAPSNKNYRIVKWKIRTKV